VRSSGSVDTGMPRRKIAIIAAMEREVKLLVRGWSRRTIEHAGQKYQLFEKGDAALICGGIGAEAARRAAEAVFGEVNPFRVLSVGFAGALDDSLEVGAICEPRTVVNARDGVRTDCGSGNGLLVSSATVADQEQKARLAKAYDAVAVDMEAAAVAQAAHAHGLEFGALKAISDAADFELPAMEGFVASDGTFQSARFAGHVALRPWLWGSTMALSRNSAMASRALCAALADYLGRDFMVQSDSSVESLVSAVNQSKVPASSTGSK